MELGSVTSLRPRTARLPLHKPSSRDRLGILTARRTSHKMGALGSGETTGLNRRLTSDAPRLPLRSLPAFGKSVTLAWQNLGGAPLTRVTRAAAGIVIATAGSSVVVVAMRQWPMPLGRGMRERFVCPRCGSSRDALHWTAEGGWGCRGRDCLDLEHPCRHTQRYCPAIHRRARLLRKLARVPSRSLRARAIRAQIAREERAMLANLKRVNSDLERRRRHVRNGRDDSGQ